MCDLAAKETFLGPGGVDWGGEGLRGRLQRWERPLEVA